MSIEWIIMYVMIVTKIYNRYGIIKLKDVKNDSIKQKW